jgi:hypothetical protein
VTGKLHTHGRAAAFFAPSALAGCSDGAEGAALGVIMLFGVFMALLFAIPEISRWRERREHRNRMYNRRPWAPEEDDDEPPEPRRRKRA